MSKDYRRWYDSDPDLKEALELLSLSTEDTKDQAAQFILNLQEKIAADVIEKLYDTITMYAGKGKRWYDNDPIMMKAIEMLRLAPPKTQRIAAKKLLIALSQNSFDDIDTNFTEE